jgi:porin
MPRLFACSCLIWVALASGVSAQESADDSASGPVFSLSPVLGGEGWGEGAASRGGTGAPTESASTAISSNPAAVNVFTGTGELGRFLGFDQDSGIRLGGAWIGDANWLMSGGLEPGEWSLAGLTLLDLTLDSEKLVGLEGGLFGIEFLQFSGQPANQDAGVVQGYNGLIGRDPLVRQELYELWWRQELFDKKLVVRIGKTVPSADFNNVSRPATGVLSNDIPSVSGLIYTPLFVNSTLQGKLPGYYNSASGITTTWVPTRDFYFSYGFYDGNLGNNEQVGLRGPQFDGHYFHIWESGLSWRIGAQPKPGKFAVGMWNQTGKLQAANGAEVDGATGAYLFGSQRLWYLRPGTDYSGVSGFYQLGYSNSNTSLARYYWGAGLTGFGLVPYRPNDSLGGGLAWAWLNTDPNAGAHFFSDTPGSSTSFRSNELMLQSYYQMQLKEGAYFQPNLSYIPNPGQRPGIQDAWALTLRVLLLF